MSAALSIRPPAVAGQFYPADRAELEILIRHVLGQAETDVRDPKALIVPHAGYIYSGATAAHAYATLDRNKVRRVLLFGPAHRVPFYGLALPDADAFATPLGEVPLDQPSMQKLMSLPHIARFPAAHVLEHSLEVQLPFLQMVLDDFTLVPVCVGSADAADVATAMLELWGSHETLIVVSSDLSHFHPYEIARNIDQQSIGRILAGDVSLSHEQACGATPVNGLLEAGRAHPLQPYLLDYRNSGDTAGDRLSVVGYTSIAFRERGGNA